MNREQRRKAVAGFFREDKIKAEQERQMIIRMHKMQRRMGEYFEETVSALKVDDLPRKISRNKILKAYVMGMMRIFSWLPPNWILTGTVMAISMMWAYPIPVPFKFLVGTVVCLVATIVGAIGFSLSVVTIPFRLLFLVAVVAFRNKMRKWGFKVMLEPMNEKGTVKTLYIKFKKNIIGKQVFEL
jgi:hypothetical protein